MEPLVSLIVATLGRTAEPERFLRHAAEQSYRNFEVIVVDQNADNRLLPMLALYRSRMRLVHLRCAPGASKARNEGVRQSRGDIVAFPDDDCWYAPALLEAIVSRFNEHPEWDGVTGRIVNETGAPSGDARFDREPGFLTLANVWRRTCAATLFLTRNTIDAIGMFDEELGPGAGTPWGGAEDIDYPARAIKRGRQLFYDPEIRVFHPDLSLDAQTDGLRRAYSYGAGIGRVWKKQQFPLRVIGYYLLRPLVGAGISFLIGRWTQSQHRWAAFRGRIFGLTSP